eukprot:789524-Prymnesium_polylepis.1
MLPGRNPRNVPGTLGTSISWQPRGISPLYENLARLGWRRSSRQRRLWSKKNGSACTAYQAALL